MDYGGTYIQPTKKLDIDNYLLMRLACLLVTFIEYNDIHA